MMLRRLLTLLIFALQPLFALATTVTGYPTNCTSVSYGGSAWSNPSRATASDNSWATASAQSGTTDYLQCTGFSFSGLPTYAVINGITVNVVRKFANTSSTAGAKDAAVRLVKAGTIGTNDRSTTTLYTTTSVSEAHGGSTDLWGDTWTAADLANTGFGVAFAASAPSVLTTLSVDAISVTVDYTALNPPTLSFQSSSSSVVTGSSVVFVATATNSNSVDLPNVVVSDTLPSGMAYVANAVTGGSVTTSGQIVTWTLPTLPANSSSTLYITATLSNTGVQSTTITSPGATSATASVFVLSAAVTQYRMDETAGSWNGTTGEVKDSGGTQLNGTRQTTGSSTTTNTVSPNPTIAASNSSVSGSFCNAGYFDGNAVVVTPSSTKFQYSTTFSASAWIYPTSYPPNDLMAILSNDVNYEFHLDPNGHLYWWWQINGTPYSMTSSIVIPKNQWTHVAITFNSSAGAGRQRIYINGVLDTNPSWAINYGGSNITGVTGTLTTNTCPFYIGGDIYTGTGCTVATNRNFHGMIDEAKLYNYELSSTEVNADMKLGRLCSGVFDHIQIEHSGTGTVCAPTNVTVKACIDAACTTLYPGTVDVRLTPADGGSISWSNNGAFSIVGGVATMTLADSSAETITLGTTSISPAPNNNVICKSGSNSSSCNFVFTGASCGFDVSEPSNNQTAHTNLYTKLAGQSFSLDVLALKSGSTTLNTSYAGTVHVDIADATSSGCPSSTSNRIADVGDITFIKGSNCGKSSASGDCGYKNVSMTSAKAARNAVVRITSGSATACSSDKFAIRPASFTITSTNANADSTGTSATATPTIKTGANFQLSASGGSGYDGTPTINNTSGYIVAHSGAIAAGTLGGTFSAADNTGTASGSAFTYNEVGYFQFAQGGVYDNTFTSVDSGVGDCVTNSTSNSLNNYRYGCNIGNMASNFFGRFIPDHLAVSATSISNRFGISNGSSSIFTYLGEPLTANFTLTAQNSTGGTTQNYAGNFARLNLSTVSQYGLAALDNGATKTLMTSRFGTPSMANTPTWTSGVAAGIAVKLTFSRKTDSSGNIVPDGPYEALQIGVLPTDSDSVGLATSALDVRMNDTTNGASDHKLVGTTKLRFGIFRLGNAYGTAQQALRLPVEAQYYNASGVFQTNYDDSATVLSTSNFTLSNFQKNLSSGVTTLSLSSTTLVSGRTYIQLSAPGAANTGSVDVCLDLGHTNCSATTAAKSYLQGPWNGGASYNQDPSARATFNAYSQNGAPIYLREIY